MSSPFHREEDVMADEIKHDPIKALELAFERIDVLSRQVRQLQDMQDSRLRLETGAENVGHNWVRPINQKEQP